MSSVRSKIADAILLKLNNVAALKYKAFDMVRLKASDFQDFELPAAQLIDLAEITVHETQRARKLWNLVIEVIVGPDSIVTVNQQTLWDLMEEMELAIFAVPNLGLRELIHMQLVSSTTDLHIMTPFYLGRIELAVHYYQKLVGDC